MGQWWIKFYQMMLGVGGWLSDEPAYEIDTPDHRRIVVEEGEFRLIDEWRMGEDQVVGTCYLFHGKTLTISGWYKGSIVGPEYTDLLKRALRARYQGQADDVGLFRGPTLFESEGDGKMYYSNEHEWATNPLGSGWNSHDRYRCDFGEEAICFPGTEENPWHRVVARNTYIVRVGE